MRRSLFAAVVRSRFNHQPVALHNEDYIKERHPHRDWVLIHKAGT